MRDYKLANELFSGMLLPVDANKLLDIPQKEVRKAAVECIIWVSWGSYDFIHFAYTFTMLTDKNYLLSIFLLFKWVHGELPRPLN